jgi:hypothetical protein
MARASTVTSQVDDVDGLENWVYILPPRTEDVL